MVTDGAGYNAFNITSYYEYGKLGNQPYDEFPVQLSCTTDALKRNGERMGYDPKQYWSDFDYGLEYYTDSAAAVTALCTGEKTLPGRIATDKDDNPLETIAEIADKQSKNTGVVTTVYFSHATPAGVYAHNISRNNLEEISKEMILESGLDVIMGCGHPWYNNDGQKLPMYKEGIFPGRKVFAKLDSGQLGWKFLDKKA
jgi:alkaline phosphatase